MEKQEENQKRSAKKEEKETLKLGDPKVPNC